MKRDLRVSLNNRGFSLSLKWGGVGVGAHLSLNGSRAVGVGVGPYSRWALIRGWTLIRINTIAHAAK